MKNKKYYDKNTKAYYIIMSSVFIVFLAIIVAFNILKKDIKFSESENRILAKKPKFKVEKLVEGKFTKKYEKYKIDQFINRDLWIEIKTNFDKMLGRNKSNGVYLSKYNYLIEEFKEPNSNAIKSNLDAINKFSDKYKRIRQHFIIAPNAIEILENNLPIFAPTLSQKKYIDNFKDKLNKNVNFIDSYKALKVHNKEYIYYKTDHHWTTLGSYYTFLEAAKSMDLNIDKIKYDIKKVSNSFFGTLSSKSGYKAKEADTIEIYIPQDKNDEYVVNYVEEQKKSASLYDSSKLNIKDKYGVFLGGNHPLTKIKTTSKEDRRLLIFKDSYANNFIPFLTPHFKEIVVIDPRYYYDDIDKLIEEESITDTLFLYNANTFFSDTSLELVLSNK
ncbi:DHHW family protein [[Clostridium] dakarense]|uniref:DHHW family protein n=1 Tax=Faecalimicrobium dakarense TaxID=1301100 RepID=UPI0004B2E40C|nr:DHHW family protein [[Clostridium] dakarense]